MVQGCAWQQRAYAKTMESRVRPLPHVPRTSCVVPSSRPGAAFCVAIRTRAAPGVAGWFRTRDAKFECVSFPVVSKGKFSR